ncbi:hypothetical protein DSM3645_23506 [Blastopirellula marina DSM 3645]|uniref:Uncharacterized protein n=1 Tax=Blastopirellula marina DSM 3645 TaxID=314230 RepID=A3ZQD5_9BACT|nr:hypothetical protein DSM3645_23506 [Blastopirellula marina DSM 3645]
MKTKATSLHFAGSPLFLFFE